MDLLERTASGGRRHPWEVVRSRFFLEVLHRHGALDQPRHWLDIGAGDGWVGEALLRRLPATSSVLCWDINYTEQDLAAGESGGVAMTGTRPATQFDGVLLLDVIEHVEDDAGFVGGIVTELVKPGGWVLVSVPAYQSLFSDHDRYLLHYRRYRPRGCAEVLERAGLELVASGGVFHSLLAARALQIAGQRVAGRQVRSGGVGVWGGGAALTRAVTAALSADARLSLELQRRGWFLPGLSYWALCRRR